MKQRKMSIFSRFLAWAANIWEKIEDLHDIRLQRQIKHGILPNMLYKKRKGDYRTWEIDAKVTSGSCLERIKAEIIEKDVEIIEKDAEISEKEAKISEKEAEISEKEAKISEKEAEISEKEAKIANSGQNYDPEADLQRSLDKNGVQDDDHALLCAEIDQMLATWPDYDGSKCPTGDYPIIYDGYQPIMRIREPKSS